ncbi:MAG: S8 family serine peptidase [Desulfamplus sp.]|nr:S8 family serine peptidase [Desulfamplus sp.]
MKNIRTTKQVSPVFTLSLLNIFITVFVLTISYAQSVYSSDWAFSLENSTNKAAHSWSEVVELSDIAILSSGKGVIVALIDSGVDTNNPIFASSLWQNKAELLNDKTLNEISDKNFDGVDNDSNGYVDDINGWNFGDNNNSITDQNGHGTNVAGIVLKSVPDAEIMILKINSGKSTTFYTDSVVNAIYYAVKNGADIINMSLSLSNDSNNVKTAILYAIKSGVVVVSAAGNSPYSISFPGTMQEVITVGATTSDGTSILWNSPTGSAIDITAPGKSVETIDLGGETVFVTGTSFSTPIVSGVVAALLGMNPNLKPATIENLIFSSAKDLGDSGRDDEFGWGVLSGSGIKRLASPSIIAKKSLTKIELSCYLPPTDSYTDVYIALVKSSLLDEYKINQYKGDADTLQYSLKNKPDESIWWLNSSGLWIADNVGVISIASLDIYDNGLNVSLFSDSGKGIWKSFSTSGFESGSYNIGIAVMGNSKLLAPIFWSPSILF